MTEIARHEAYRGAAMLAGNIAVVTGGGQRLGEAIARLFAERGAAGIAICGRDAAKGERVAKSIADTGTPKNFVRVWFADVAVHRKVNAKADRLFGGVDALFNVAAPATAVASSTQPRSATSRSRT